MYVYLLVTGSFAIVLAVSVVKWRCPSCRKFTGVKGRKVAKGGAFSRTHYKYSCTSCRHIWKTGGF